MGNAASASGTPEQIGDALPTASLKHGGFRIIGIAEDGPGAQTKVFPGPTNTLTEPIISPLVSWFDFLVSMNGLPLSGPDVLQSEVQSNVDKPCLIEIYSSKTGTLRSASITPSRGWSGGSDSLLGLHVRYEPSLPSYPSSSPEAEDRAFHVVAVEEGSPAEFACFSPGDDWIVGGLDGPFRSMEQLGEYLQKGSESSSEASVAGSALLFVLRQSTDTVRRVTLRGMHTPWRNSKGKEQTGAGLELAEGALHPLPNRDCCGLNEFSLLPGYNMGFRDSSSSSFGAALSAEGGAFAELQQQEGEGSELETVDASSLTGAASDAMGTGGAALVTPAKKQHQQEQGGEEGGEEEQLQQVQALSPQEQLTEQHRAKLQLLAASLQKATAPSPFAAAAAASEMAFATAGFASFPSIGSALAAARNTGGAAAGGGAGTGTAASRSAAGVPSSASMASL